MKRRSAKKLKKSKRRSTNLKKSKLRSAKKSRKNREKVVKQKILIQPNYY